MTSCTLQRAGGPEGLSIDRGEVTAVQGALNFNTMSVKGDVGETYTLQFACPGYSSLPVNLTISPCKPGSALSSARTCEYCPPDQYSPRGEACLQCPTGASCRRSLVLEGRTIIAGSALPATLPGYWQYKAPLSVVEPMGAYCFWDATQCVPGRYVPSLLF